MPTFPIATVAVESDREDSLSSSSSTRTASPVARTAAIASSPQFTPRALALGSSGGGGGGLAVRQRGSFTFPNTSSPPIFSHNDANRSPQEGEVNLTGGGGVGVGGANSNKMWGRLATQVVGGGRTYRTPASVYGFTEEEEMRQAPSPFRRSPSRKSFGSGEGNSNNNTTHINNHSRGGGGGGGADTSSQTATADNNDNNYSANGLRTRSFRRTVSIAFAANHEEDIGGREGRDGRRFSSLPNSSAGGESGEVVKEKVRRVSSSFGRALSQKGRSASSGGEGNLPVAAATRSLSVASGGSNASSSAYFLRDIGIASDAEGRLISDIKIGAFDKKADEIPFHKALQKDKMLLFLYRIFPNSARQVYVGQKTATRLDSFVRFMAFYKLKRENTSHLRCLEDVNVVVDSIKLCLRATSHSTQHLVLLSNRLMRAVKTCQRFIRKALANLRAQKEVIFRRWVVAEDKARETLKAEIESRARSLQCQYSSTSQVKDITRHLQMLFLDCWVSNSRKLDAIDSLWGERRDAYCAHYRAWREDRVKQLMVQHEQRLLRQMEEHGDLFALAAGNASPANNTVDSTEEGDQEDEATEVRKILLGGGIARSSTVKAVFSRSAALRRGLMGFRQLHFNGASITLKELCAHLQLQSIRSVISSIPIESKEALLFIQQQPTFVGDLAALPNIVSYYHALLVIPPHHNNMILLLLLRQHVEETTQRTRRMAAAVGTSSSSSSSSSSSAKSTLHSSDADGNGGSSREHPLPPVGPTTLKNLKEKAKGITDQWHSSVGTGGSASLAGDGSMGRGDGGGAVNNSNTSCTGVERRHALAQRQSLLGGAASHHHYSSGSTNSNDPHRRRSLPMIVTSSSGHEGPSLSSGAGRTPASAALASASFLKDYSPRTRLMLMRRVTDAMQPPPSAAAIFTSGPPHNPPATSATAASPPSTTAVNNNSAILNSPQPPKSRRSGVDVDDSMMAKMARAMDESAIPFAPFSPSPPRRGSSGGGPRLTPTTTGTHTDDGVKKRRASMAADGINKKGGGRDGYSAAAALAAVAAVAGSAHNPEEGFRRLPPPTASCSSPPLPSSSSTAGDGPVLEFDVEKYCSPRYASINQHLAAPLGSNLSNAANERKHAGDVGRGGGSDSGHVGGAMAPSSSSLNPSHYLAPPSASSPPVGLMPFFSPSSKVGGTAQKRPMSADAAASGRHSSGNSGLLNHPHDHYTTAVAIPSAPHCGSSPAAVAKAASATAMASSSSALSGHRRPLLASPRNIKSGAIMTTTTAAAASNTNAVASHRGGDYIDVEAATAEHIASEMAKIAAKTLKKQLSAAATASTTPRRRPSSAVNTATPKQRAKRSNDGAICMM